MNQTGADRERNREMERLTECETGLTECETLRERKGRLIGKGVSATQLSVDVRAGERFDEAEERVRSSSVFRALVCPGVPGARVLCWRGFASALDAE